MSDSKQARATLDKSLNLIADLITSLKEQSSDQTRVLPQLEIPELPPGAESELKALMEQAQKTLSPHENLQQFIEDAERFKEYAQRLSRFDPHVTALSLQVDNWSERIRSKPLAHVSFNLLPLFTSPEDEDSPMFSVSITNTGTAETGPILLRMVAGNQEVQECLINPLMPGESTLSKTFTLDRSNALQLTAYCRHRTEAGESDSRLLLSTIMKPTAATDSGKELVNPYVADRPVYAGEPQVERTEIVRRIEDCIRQNNGGIIHLWGLRRVGKTSLLYNLIHRANKNAVACIPVYINCVIFEREKPWKYEEFLGVLSQAIVSRLHEEEELHDKIQEAEEVLRPADDGSITLEMFVSFVDNSIALVSPSKLMLMFDDADVFGEDRLGEIRGFLFDGKDFDEKIHGVFKCLAYGANPNAHSLFVLFGTGKALGQLWSNVETSVRMRDRVRFFERDEIREFIEKGRNTPLEYDDLAFEYLWRVTGGYPALVQLVCSAVVHKWNEEGLGSSIIHFPLVRKAVRNLVRDAELEGYFKYLYRYGIPKEAHEAFKIISMTDGAVDVRTMQIDMQKCAIEKDGFDELATSQILQRVGESVFLRVGLFKLLVEKYDMSEAYE